MDSKPVFFITVTERLEGDEFIFCDTGDARCWGFYFDRQRAVDALHMNITDLRETCYNYAVIEEYCEGISGYNFKRQFFKWDSVKEGFFEIDEPQCVKHICSFSIG